MRASKPGWNLVAMHDPAGRRGIWMRHNEDKQTVEICAGREGDDMYIKLTSHTFVSPADIQMLQQIMLAGIWSIDLAHDDGQIVSETWSKKDT